MTFEAYAIAVRISIVNDVTAGLATLSRQFKSAEKDVAALQGRLNEVRRLGGLALAGAGVAGAGFMGLGLIGRLIKPAEEYTHQLALMNIAGLRQAEIADAVGAAWKTTGDVITSTAADNLRVIRELRIVLGSTEEAVKALPQMQMLDAVLQAQTGGKRSSQDVGYAAAKALELRGVSMNPKAFMEQADLIARGMIATGGKVGPDAMLQAIKYAGQYGATFSNRFVYGILPTLIQEYGASSTGTAITSLMRALTGGTLTPAAAKALSGLTLHGHPLLDMKQYQDFKSGMPGVTALGAIQGTEKGISDPDLWVQNYLMAALDESGIKDPLKRAAVMGVIFSNRTAGRMAYMLGTQGQRLDKDFDLIQKAQGIRGYYGLIKDDPTVAWKALDAQLDNLKTSLAINVVPVILPMLEKLTRGLNNFGEWARSHPDLTKDLIVGFAGLSAAMAIGGTLTATTLAIRGMNAATTALQISLLSASGGGAVEAVGLLTALSLQFVKYLGAAGIGLAGGALIGTGLDWLIGKGLTAATGGKVMSLGDLLYSANPFNDRYDPNAQVSRRSDPQFAGNWSPLRPPNTINLKAELHVDNQKMAEKTLRYVERETARAQRSGPSTFDPNMSLLPVGVPVNR